MVIHAPPEVSAAAVVVTTSFLLEFYGNSSLFAVGGRLRGHSRHTRSKGRSSRLSDSLVRLRLQPGPNWLPLLCSDWANSAGSKVAPSRSNTDGRKDATNTSPRSPRSLSG